MNNAVIWKAVEGFEGLYEISNTGLLRTTARITECVDGRRRRIESKVIKPHIQSCGYLQFCLYKSGKLYPRKIHRLVAIAHIPNPDNLREVNHIDGNKQNNHVDNLTWCNRSENMKHAFSERLVSNAGFKNANCKLTKDEIASIKKMYATSQHSHKQLANLFNVSKATITAILNNKRWSDVA